MKLVNNLICYLFQNCAVGVPLRYPVTDPATKNIRFENIPVSAEGFFEEDPVVVNQKLSSSCAAWPMLKNACSIIDFEKHLDESTCFILNGRNRVSICGDDDFIPVRFVAVESIFEATQIAVGTRMTRFHTYCRITK